MKRVCNASTRIIHYRYYLLDIFFSLRSMILNLPKIYGFYMTSSQQKLNPHSVCQPKSVLYFCKRMSHYIHENWRLIPAIKYYSHLSPLEDTNMYQQGLFGKMLKNIYEIVFNSDFKRALALLYSAVVHDIPTFLQYSKTSTFLK